MKIKEPIIFQIADRTWCINEFGMDALFLLEGDEKALLIDTGTSVFDIPAFVKRFTDKPLIVVLTHGHVDHAGGITWFEKVYLHEDDFEMARTLSREERIGFMHYIVEQSDGLYDLNDESVINGPYEPELLPLVEGDVIHLGNRDVVVYETPGHTLGSISFLDVKERILFTGDACNGNTLLICSADTDSEKGTMTALLNSAKKIESLKPFYDRNYNGHIGFGPAITVMNPLPESLTRDCIELCEKLLDGSVIGELNTRNEENDSLIARNRTMQIVYAKEQLR